MRQGDSDREIARSKTMGRKKIAQVREVANARGWLAAGTDLPDDTVLAAALMPQMLSPLKRKKPRRSGFRNTNISYRETHSHAIING
jgi:hypothetical protein